VCDREKTLRISLLSIPAYSDGDTIETSLSGSRITWTRAIESRDDD